MWEKDIAEIQEEKQKFKTESEKKAQAMQEIAKKIESNTFEFTADLENATLNDVQASSDKLQNNIARMITGLNDTTRNIDGALSEMGALTKTEKFVKFFSASKSKEMHTTRISESDISDNLQELIRQSETIVSILSEQEKELINERDLANVNYEKTLSARKSTVEEMEEVRKSMLELDPVIMDLQSQLDVESSPVGRTNLESELSKQQANLNKLKNEEAKLLGRSESLEKYIVQNKVHIQSLEKQLTGQQVLIETIMTDSEQRTVLFRQYETSLKTAQMQETAYQLSEIGSEVDKSSMEGMAQIGAAAGNRLAGMLESHKSEMAIRKELEKRQSDVHERLNRRFSAALEEHNKGDYN